MSIIASHEGVPQRDLADKLMRHESAIGPIANRLRRLATLPERGLILVVGQGFRNQQKVISLYAS